MADANVLKVWRGRRIERLDSAKDLTTYAMPPLKTREYARRALGCPSLTPMQTEQQLFEFLRICRYVPDEEQFGQKEYWQMPDEFERRRAGDCEDHALYAWRKLVDLGRKARFMVGDSERTAHAWVVVVDGEDVRVLETTAKQRLEFVPAVEARRYTPLYSIDKSLNFYRHS